MAAVNEHRVTRDPGVSDEEYFFVQPPRAALTSALGESSVFPQTVFVLWLSPRWLLEAKFCGAFGITYILVLFLLKRLGISVGLKDFFFLSSSGFIQTLIDT